MIPGERRATTTAVCDTLQDEERRKGLRIPQETKCFKVPPEANLWPRPESPAPLGSGGRPMGRLSSFTCRVILLMDFVVRYARIYMCVWALVLRSCWQMWTCLQPQTKLRLLEEEDGPSFPGYERREGGGGASFFSPGGGDHDDGPWVDQLRVEERVPAAAVQVGALDHVGVGVHPEHQPALHVHGQTLGADQICTAGGGGWERRGERNVEISGFAM